MIGTILDPPYFLLDTTFKSMFMLHKHESGHGNRHEPRHRRTRGHIHGHRDGYGHRHGLGHSNIVMLNIRYQSKMLHPISNIMSHSTLVSPISEDPTLYQAQSDIIHHGHRTERPPMQNKQPFPVTRL